MEWNIEEYVVYLLRSLYKKEWKGKKYASQE